MHLLTSNVGGDQRSGSGGTSEASGIGSCWSYHSGAEDFNALMAKLCDDFETNQEESKFELCDTIRAVLRSFPKVRVIYRLLRRKGILSLPVPKSLNNVTSFLFII